MHGNHDSSAMNISKRLSQILPSRFAATISLAAAAFGATAMGVGCLTSRASAKESSRDYSVTVLGDIHYDAPPLERFHTPQRPGHHKCHVAMWETDMPGMLAASASLVGPDTAFALQLGDLIDGATLGYDAQTQMLAEATAVLEKTYPTIPVISVCGNHDYIGGWRKGYSSFMIPWLSRQVAPLTTNTVTSTTFGFRHGPDLWVFINYNDAEATVPIVEKILSDNPDVRYTFIALHGPVLPMDMFRFRWFYLGDERQDKVRRKVRALLAQRDAIVLAGHVHTLECKEWHGDGGRITEMVVNTVSRYGNSIQKPAIPQVMSETPDDYGAWLKSAPTNNFNLKFDALYEEYRPGLKRRYGAWAAGHNILRVSDSGVSLEYYGLDAREPTKVFQLR